jgi:hypothetical protein
MWGSVVALGTHNPHLRYDVRERSLPWSISVTMIGIGQPEPLDGSIVSMRNIVVSSCYRNWLARTSSGAMAALPKNAAATVVVTRLL